MTETLRSLREDTIQTVAKFFGSPEGKAITAKAVAGQRQAIHAERLATVAEQARLNAADAEAATAYERRIRPLIMLVADLERQCEAAREQVRACQSEHRTSQLSRSQAIQRCEARLYATRPHEEVESFVAELTERGDGLRRESDEVSSRGIDGKMYRRWDNNPSWFACRDAIAAAILQARNLWREALTDDELQTRFEALRRQIPAVESRPEGWRRL